MWMVILILIFIIIISYWFTRFFIFPPPKWCQSQQCLVGKTTLITGANTGIGYITALDFAKRGARVLIACRDAKKAEEARLKIIEETDNPNIYTKIVDFTSFASVRQLAKDINNTESRLDILVNNIGMSFGYDGTTIDGHDIVMQVNYYSHFLLTHLLIGLMLKSEEPGRIVNVSSLAAKYATSFDLDKSHKNEGNLASYANSKLCNIFFTKELAKRLQNTKITTYSLHPGGIKTNIFQTAKGIHQLALKFIVNLFYYPVELGAQTVIYCSLQKNLERFTGQHFDCSWRIDDYKTARNPVLPKKLWEITERIVEIRNEEKINFDK